MRHSSAPVLLQVIDLIPDRLRARVYSTVIVEKDNEAAGWLYVTMGLDQVGQYELTFLLKREAHEQEADISPTPLQWFAVAYELASNGRTVGEGDLTELGSPGLFPGDDVKGFLYQPHGHYEGISLSPGTLAVIPLLSDEVEAVKHFGRARVLALLGKTDRCFPYPEWFIRNRESVLDFAAYEQHSILARVGVIKLRYASVYSCGPTVALRVPLDEATALHQSLATVPDGQAFALLTSPSPGADAALVWHPGQTRPNAIAEVYVAKDPTGGQAMGGSFLIVTPGVEEGSVRMLEDGFGVALPSPDWSRFLSAVEKSKPFGFQGKGPYAGSMVREFLLQWYESTYSSPFGERFHAQGGFSAYMSSELYGGEPHARTSERTFALASIMLLQDQREIDDRISTEELAEFISLADMIVNDHFAGRSTTSNEIMLEFTLSAAAPAQVRIAAAPDFDKELLSGLYERLCAAQSPQVRGGSVRFQIHFRHTE